MFGRQLGKAAIAQLREVIREEIRAELDRVMSPTFRDTVVRGQREMEHIFDAVLEFQSDLDELKARMEFWEKLGRV